ncbi:glucan endo-1,3-beta-glucosidase-like [Pistacia vera]|uniref:glucan endo-1,3-beta-glucosidase-like n=1 Tax=Pistacia vera TaxID=55513 RepID=UPI00126362EF|nr:glucan endo-1,3-beta-glucosidase-like [Pistacia vera]
MSLWSLVVITLYRKCGIEFIRLFEPNREVLEALRSSNILVSLGVRTEDLKSLALSNEVIPSPYTMDVYGAMNNMHTAINSVGLVSTRVTAVISTQALAKSFPPPSGEFSNQAFPAMNDVTAFLSRTGTPLMINVYPYFAYASDPKHISFEYATFNAKQPVVVDGNFKYYNLFDAMVDDVYAALEKVNAGNVSTYISGTGWPSAGKKPYTSEENARIYDQNLYSHVLSGETPRRPDNLLDVFTYEMFNENKKESGVEQNFGLFYPNTLPVYKFFETC